MPDVPLQNHQKPGSNQAIGRPSEFGFRFEITHSGSWPALVRPVLEKVDPWYAILFLPYIALVASRRQNAFGFGDVFYLGIRPEHMLLAGQTPLNVPAVAVSIQLWPPRCWGLFGGPP